MVQKLISLLFCLQSSSLVIAEPPADPFAQDTLLEDPFVSTQIAQQTDEEEDKEQSEHRFRIEGKSYYQENSLKGMHPFNPGFQNLFDDYAGFVGLDAEVDSNWGGQWGTRARVFSRYLAQPSDTLQENEADNTEVKSWLLEGVVHWQSADHRLNIELGRNRPQWSNGYNYDIANLLQPQRTRPFINQDDPLQSKGWDMLDVQYIQGQWSFSGYLVNSDSPYFDASIEAVLRVGYQGDNTVSLLAHKIEGNRLAWAATWSRLLTDNMSLRTEWTVHPYRQFDFLGEKSQSYYQRVVLGTTFTADDGWTLIAEYFNNEHGANDREWQQITQSSAAAAERVRSGQSVDFAGDISTALAGLNFIRSGWLRQSYASLLFISAESENLWQLRLGSQISLDDNSRLSRVEILKSFNDHLSGRLQLESFDGCELCEYGVNPNENTIRLVFSWLF